MEVREKVNSQAWPCRVLALKGSGAKLGICSAPTSQS